MRVGMFSPYYETLGGGERYFFTAAEFFLKRGDSVEIFWDGDNYAAEVQKRFNIDISGVRFVPDIFSKKRARLARLGETAKYDLIFFLSDGSVPLSLAKKTILHFQAPFIRSNRRSLVNWWKFRRISAVICNSKFTKKYIDKTFGIHSLVVYPPVDVEAFFPGIKENMIISVGRFFAPDHPKKQETLIRAFVELYKAGLRGWQLVLVGGVTGTSQDDVARLRQKSTGYPIKIITDVGFAKLRQYYSQAKVYWHAAGFGEDLVKFPYKAEHFGITTVEAMAAGCVPVAFAGGGQGEIIDNGANGFLWQTTEQLKDLTREIAGDEKKRRILAQAARQKSWMFTKNRFFHNLEEVLSA